jgi:hypothetical protein
MTTNSVIDFDSFMKTDGIYESTILNFYDSQIFFTIETLLPVINDNLWKLKTLLCRCFSDLMNGITSLQICESTGAS